MTTKLPAKYDLEARYVPAVLCSAPFIALGFYFIVGIDAGFWSKLFALSFGGITMTVALYKLADQSCRLAGKYLEHVIFKNGTNFPTTAYLLAGDTTFTSHRKTELIQKIKALVKVDLSSFTKDNLTNRKRVNEVIGQVRRRFVGKNAMVTQRNIQYGFFRNLAGGTLLAIPASILGIALASFKHSLTAMRVSEVLLTCYLIILVLAVPVLKFLAKQYALTLFDELLGS
jgi:hypothetical protein